MRLTNVAHLRLPFGRLLGYDVRVSELGRELPISFDQARHMGAGDRPGSWMALSLALGEPVPRERLAAAWLAVIAKHGTLRTVFAQDPAPRDENPASSDRASRVPMLREVEIHPGEWVEERIAPGEAVNDALRRVFDVSCSPHARPSHRLCVLETAKGSTVVVAADHAHVDMWSMLVIARDLLAAIAQLETGADAKLSVAPAFAEHTAELRERESAPPEVHRRWAEILAAGGNAMPCFPLPLGPAGAHPERVEVRDVLDLGMSAAFSRRARDAGVSTLSLAVSVMAEVTWEVAAAPLRAVFPVHSRFDERWYDSVGWFITNSVIEVADPDPVACAAAVRKAVQLGSWPLADVLAPWGGMSEAPGMFAISWLDLRRLPVSVDSVGLDAQYVGATIRTDGVMLWFIFDEGGLHLRCRYPDTDEGRQHVGGWLDLLVSRLRAG